MTIGEIIKNSSGYAVFSHYRQGYLYYDLSVIDGTDEYDRQGVKATKYVFPVEVADLGIATLNYMEKPITMMRYIRKAVEGNMFVRGA